MNSFIPLSIPNFIGNELKYVTDAVQAGWVSTGGAYITKFEQVVSEYLHSAGAVACQSGTAGIHTGLMVMGVTSEDAVLVPTLTFIAAVNPVMYVNAEPIFMDCDDSLCMDPVKLKLFCEEECDFRNGQLISKNSGRHIKAIIVVHVFGNMADMESIMAVAAMYNLLVLEDATEALGTYYSSGKFKGKYAGTIGDLGVYSFNGNKIITTGGGGMLVSDNLKYLQHARHLTTQAKSDELYYTHDEIGYNYRMTNLQAALGVAQLEQLEHFIQIKTENFKQYQNSLAQDGIHLLTYRDNIRSNHWFYALDTAGLCLDRDSLIAYLASKGIQTRPVWGLIHEQKPYNNKEVYKIEKAKVFWQKVINIPCSTSLTKSDIEYVTNVLKQINRDE
ncbi:LegC family aminotransferase [Diplocloster agilis]|uniref:LegC family aminotransferase n=1 Tax=Diplocloster agilis TaxID=2850323 RepID=UPI0008208550|nr:LegC family aminotransferase [Suonthocola fibrivorans]MCU6733102.1 LegC family aminotransferase [Suonthocola fibrivorans]SCI75405.1 UDP-4-amino-4-deoxy-L-arabinose--oxoglutarate aminotransferase [uncultured Clostridium sp.]